MKITVIIILCLFSFFCSAYASDNYEARKFAQEYAQEIKENVREERNAWSINADIKAGVATYEEEEQTVRSEYEAIYPEVLFAAVYQSENDVETAVNFSYGQSTTDTETWYISDIKYQTNDLDFYRMNIKGSVGKILYSDRYKDLQVIPFLGYGFRYINFKRTNFNILNIITSREVVTEKYYIHHLNFGIKLNKKLNDKFSISGLGSYAYVFYNQADNSALGTIKGGGGFLVEGNIDLQYSLTDSWKLIFGGFIELQDLKGGNKGDVIWPDNKLNIYGGNIGIQCNF